MSSPTLMKTTEFIRFLSVYCKDMQAAESPSDQQKEVYVSIGKMIESYLQDYKAARRLTAIAEETMMEAIAEDKRRQFDNPVELIAHVHEIASRPAFFDSERISLAAIDGFCRDFITANEQKVHQEQINNATF
jgi:hypothetical protein